MDKTAFSENNVSHTATFNEIKAQYGSIDMTFEDEALSTTAPESTVVSSVSVDGTAEEAAKAVTEDVDDDSVAMARTAALGDGSGLHSLPIYFFKPEIDRNERIIRDVSVISYGEALGHGLWVDETFLSQVVQFAAENLPRGVPMRWMHPTFCDDGMGKQVARVRNLRFDRETLSVRGDVYFYKKTAGTRSEFIEEIMNLAEEDPEVLGISIVFDPDFDAMNRFVREHDQDGRGFVSPDKRNTENYPHVRLKKLYYADFVAEPAANPRGLFTRRFATSEMLRLLDRGDIARCLFYILCPSFKIEPTLEERRKFVGSIGIGIDDVRDYVHSFLSRYNLAIVNSEELSKWLNSKTGRKAFRAISYRQAHPGGTPLADRDTPWDGPAEVSRASVDDLKVMCAWVEDGKEDNKTAYKFPHHKASGDHPVVWRAVANAAARLPQANIPESDVPGVQAHLSRHYREFDEEPPWSRYPEAWQFYVETVFGETIDDDEELAEILEDCGLIIEAQALSKKKILENIQKIIDNRIKEFIIAVTGRRI